MLQGMELTRTNRSGGLTTFFYPALRSIRAPAGGATQRPTLRLEARREKVKSITLRRSHSITLVIVSGFD